MLLRRHDSTHSARGSPEPRPDPARRAVGRVPAAAPKAATPWPAGGPAHATRRREVGCATARTGLRETRGEGQGLGGPAGSRPRCLSPAFAVPAHAPRRAGEQARTAQSQSGAGGRHPMDGSPGWGVSPRAWGRCPPQEPPAQARQGGHSHVASRDLPTPSLSTTKGKVTSQGRGCRHHPNQVIKETSPVT